MQNYKPSIIENYVYNNNENGILKGGYPLKMFAEEEEFRTKMLGGGLVESIGIEKFDEYVIPIGLFHQHEDGVAHETKTKKYNKKPVEVIDDDMFDKMFSLVSKMRTRPNTRKFRHIDNKTKKNN